MATWGEELRHWREMAGLSRTQLARCARVSPKNIYNLEMRGQRPTIGTVRILADALDTVLGQMSDGWSDDERRQFRLGPRPVDPDTSVGTDAETDTVLSVDAGTPVSVPVAEPPTTADAALADPESSEGPSSVDRAPRTASTLPRSPQGHARVRALVRGLAVVITVGLAAILISRAIPPVTADEGAVVTPGISQASAPRAVGPDMTAPRWWLSNDRAATRHSGTGISWGRVDDIPLVGDWDGRRGDELTVYRPSDANFYWSKNDAVHIDYAEPGDWPLVGNWDGAGSDEPGVYRPSTSEFLLGHDSTHLTTVQWGHPGDIPVIGDWDGDHLDDLAVFHPDSLVVDRRTLDDREFAPLTVGSKGDIPLAGDWTGDEVDEFAVYRPTTRTFVFMDAVGVETSHVIYGASGVQVIPVIGDWDHDGKDSQGVVQQ